jgi:hypothetical protein
MDRATSPKWAFLFVNDRFDQDASVLSLPPQYLAPRQPEREHMSSTIQTAAPPPSPNLPPSFRGWGGRTRSAQRCDGEAEHIEFAPSPSVRQPSSSTAAHNHGHAEANHLRPQKAPSIAALEQHAAHVNGDKATGGNEHRQDSMFFDTSGYDIFGLSPRPQPASKFMSQQGPARPMSGPFSDAQRPPYPALWWGDLSSATTKTVAKSSPATNPDPLLEAQRRTMEQIRRTVGKVAPIEPTMEMPPSSSFVPECRHPVWRWRSSPPSSSPTPGLEYPFRGDAYPFEDPAADSENPLTKDEIAFLEEARLRNAQPPEKPTVSPPPPKPFNKSSVEKTEPVEHMWNNTSGVHHTLSFNKEAARKAVEEGAKTWYKPSKRLSDQIKASSLPKPAEKKQENPEAAQTKPTALHKYADAISEQTKASSIPKPSEKKHENPEAAQTKPTALHKYADAISEQTKASSIPKPSEKKHENPEAAQTKPTAPHKYAAEIARAKRAKKDFLENSTKKATPKAPTKPQELKSESTHSTLAQDKKQLIKQIKESIQASHLENDLKGMLGVGQKDLKSSSPTKQLQVQANQKRPPRTTAEEYYRKMQAAAKLQASLAPSGNKAKKSSWVSISMPQTEAGVVKKEEAKPKTSVFKKKTVDEEVEKKMEALKDEFEDLSLGSDEEEGWEKISGDLDEWEVVDGLVR